MSDLLSVVLRYLTALDEYEEERWHRHPNQPAITRTRQALDVVEEELRTAVHKETP